MSQSFYPSLKTTKNVTISLHGSHGNWKETPQKEKGVGYHLSCDMMINEC